MTNDLTTAVKIARNFMSQNPHGNFTIAGSVITTSAGLAYRVENIEGEWCWHCINGDVTVKGCTSRVAADLIPA